MKRKSLNSTFIDIAKIFAGRATCPRGRVGVIIVKEGRIIASGYNGSLEGEPHCEDVGCDIDEKTGACIRTLHGEVNAILFAAKAGISTKDSILYTTLSPCLNCAKLIIAAGIKAVYYSSEYRDTKSIEFLRKRNIVCRLVE